MNQTYSDKVCKTALIAEKLVKLTAVERQAVVVELLKNTTERELGEELGIPHSTIHDWKTLRQNNVGENLHVSLRMIKRKLQNFKPQNGDDIKYLTEIRNIIEEILKSTN